MTDHELNKHLADASGIEVEEAYSLLGTDPAWYFTYHDEWSPTTDWNQAMRCAEELCPEKTWQVNPDYVEVFSVEGQLLFSVPREHNDSLLRTFCHVILQALEHNRGFQDV